MYGPVNPQRWQCRLLFSWNVIGYQFTSEISHHQFSLIMMICVWGTHFADNLTIDAQKPAKNLQNLLDKVSHFNYHKVISSNLHLFSNYNFIF